MKSKTRTIGIVIAVILTLAALFYLGGLVCQLLTQYQVWLDSGGLSGKAQIGDIQFGPVACWIQAFTWSGLDNSKITYQSFARKCFTRLQNRKFKDILPVINRSILCLLVSILLLLLANIVILNGRVIGIAVKIIASKRCTPFSGPRSATGAISHPTYWACEFFVQQCN